MYTDKLPNALRTLEAIELNRIKLTKKSYCRYAGIIHTAIPVSRQMCDQIVFCSDQIDPESHLASFVNVILSSLKKPIKPPRVPRYKVFGDPNDSDEDDPLILSSFELFTTGKASTLTPQPAKSNVRMIKSETAITELKKAAKPDDQILTTQEEPPSARTPEPPSPIRYELVEDEEKPQPEEPEPDQSSSNSSPISIREPNVEPVASSPKESAPSSLSNSGWIDDILMTKP